MTLKERCEEALHDIKMEFFNEMKDLMWDYDIDRVLYDESYEISPEADAKWDELVDYSEDWNHEFWGWLEVQKLNEKYKL